jgi:hypothetical protein
VKRIDIAERCSRLAVRHHVAPEARVEHVLDAARGVVCLHGTDPSTVYLSAWARTREPSLGAVDRALYEDRSLVRMLAMRRTVFVVDVAEAPILQSAASRAVARQERKRNVQLAGMLEVDDPARWLEEAEAATLAALVRMGEASAQELKRDVPMLQARVRVNRGKKYEGNIGMASRMLLLLGVEGRIVRTRPRGTWISSQFRWTPWERWLGETMAEVPVADAQAQLARRWLDRFGPGTEDDIRWWAGWTVRDTRAAIAAAGAVEVELDEGVGYVLPDDLEPTPTPVPWVALLPALDPTTMGWRDRGWYLGGHRDALFDTNGNAGPTIWVDGRIVGGWGVRQGGEVVTRLLEDVGREPERAIDAEAARLTGMLQEVRVVPRFATPLAMELAR